MRTREFTFLALSLLWASPTPSIAFPEPPTPVEPSLIYYDRTQGGVSLVQLWKWIELSANHQAIFTTTPEAFSNKLPVSEWASVIVIHKKTPAEPAYASALREFATAHQEVPIQLFIWHDNGEQPTQDIAVLGTTAIVRWQRCSTTTSYSLTANPSSEAVRARTVPSLLFPDFGGIQLATLKAIGPYYETVENDTVQSVMVQAQPCQHKCFEFLLTQTEACNANRDAHIADCHFLFGPTDTDPGNPTEWIECLQQADRDHSECLGHALHRFNLCTARCRGRVPVPESQPAPPPP